MIMAPFSIPAPCIIPLRLPVFGGPKSIDTDTKIQLLCETQLDYEIFYTLDGTKPQPYAGIVQGSKTIKYDSPFYLPPGKVTIRAMAIHPNIHAMCSSVVTKCYEVLKGSTEYIIHSAKMKPPKNKKTKKHSVPSDEKIDYENEEKYDSMNHKFDTSSFKSHETNCLEEAFIGGSDFETVVSDVEDSIEDQTDFPSMPFEDSNYDDNVEESEDSKLLDNVDEIDTVRNDGKAYFDAEETFTLPEGKDEVEQNLAGASNSGTSVETQFCCMKCDMTLQHCSSCNRMNAVSSKFCIDCGKQLTKLCIFCKEYNPCIATFCQFCGKKLGSTLNSQLELNPKVNHSVMVKPDLKNVSIQKIPVLVDKQIQTVNEKSPVKKSAPRFQQKLMARHSPGRGYWHQQLDYICNHLKSHAYNNIEFRKEISEPTLCDFKSAQISKDENNVTVTIIFSPLITDKNIINASEETKPKD